jgi:DNA-binding NarL/FixJ family response regulator
MPPLLVVNLWFAYYYRCMSAVHSTLPGRDREFSRLTASLTDAVAGIGSALVVEGEPGIGKTALVRALGEVAVARGCRVLRGAGDELGRSLPLVPLLEALHVTDASDDPEHEAIVELLSGDPTHSALSSADLVAAAGERLLRLVEQECTQRPTLLVIDDLQWADRVTMAVWSRLARLAPQLPLLLVATVRLGAARDELAVMPVAATRVRLGPLAHTAVATVVATLVNGTPAPRLLALADDAGGNPLYLTELVDALRRDNALQVMDGGAVETTAAKAPSSLSAAIAGRLDFLGGPARHVLRAAALLGVRFCVVDLGVVLHQHVAELAPVLDAACSAGVLADAEGDLSFRHPLVRSALYEEIPGPVRGAWHLEVAKALAEDGAAVDDVARQLVAAFDGAGSLSTTARAEGWLRDWLVERGMLLVHKAPAAAAAILHRAVAAAETDSRHPALVAQLAEALFRAGEVRDAERVAREALADEHITDPRRRADLHWTLAQCRATTGRSAESLRDLDAALAQPETLDGPALARLRVLAARAHWDIGDLDAADEMAGAALASAGKDRGAAGWALHVRAIVSMEHGRMRETLPLLERALELVDASPTTVDLRLLLQINSAVVHAELDQTEQAVEIAEQARDTADRSGHLIRLAQSHSALGQLLYGLGRWDAAALEVSCLIDELKHPMVSCCDHGIAALVALHRGDLPSARAHLDAAEPYRARLGDHTIATLSLAWSLWHERAGDLTEAADALRPALVEGRNAEDLLPDLVRLGLELGDTATARLATKRAAGLAAEANVPHRDAVLDYCAGLLAEDPQRLLRAAALCGAAGRPLLGARSFEAAAVAFAAHDDRDSAKAALTRAVDQYLALDADWQVTRAQARLRVYRIGSGPRVKHSKARTGWNSLTPKEVTVAELIVEGLSNAQIAARLFLSPRTVATHVSHILGKLQVRTRTDIAREVCRRAASS